MEPSPPVGPAIHIRGAREHNLQNLEVRLPRDRLVVITGVSGSGKSSLAFDTLYAEGYRKYMDSLSTQARQVLEQVKRPDVDFIHGLSPVIAIEQRTGGGANPRSTVATVTEIADYARLLWALGGTPFCPKDGGRILRRSLDDIVNFLLSHPEGTRIVLLAPFVTAKPAVLRGELPHLRQRGFQRVRLRDQVLEIDDVERALPGGTEPRALDLVVDRLIVRADQRSRLADSLELALREGRQQASALVQPPGAENWSEVALSQQPACAVCGTVYAPLTPRSFSYNHPDGACPTCGGLGRTLQFAEELVVPDPTLSVREGAVKPWRLGSKRMIIRHNALLKQLAEQLPFDPHVPWADLSSEVRQVILHGSGDRLFPFKLKGGKSKPELMPFPGVLPDLEEIRRETSSDGLKARLLAFQTSAECPLCHGQRLRPESRAVRLNGLGFADFMSRDLREAARFADGVEAGVLSEAADGLRERLRFLNEVGLHYLSLEREYTTLSGGEAQRVRLATQLGMGLVGVAYVLDEPTVGLHPSDTQRLLESLLDLQRRGNAVIVVEHDPEVIRAAGHLVEIGPGAGPRGGRLVFQGPVDEAMRHPVSLSGAYLSGRLRVERNGPALAPGDAWLRVLGAREHNLRDVDVAFPVGRLTCVTGVSGSGKSSLVNDTLAEAAAFKLNRARVVPGRHRAIEGLENFDRLVRVDQDPMGRSARSNPATYTKIFDDLRALYARTPLAKVRGYGPSRFSFNVSGGRCERCRGEGRIQLDMQFLHDVFIECPSCHGQRYNRETLEVRFKGLSIAEVLELEVEKAAEVFARVPNMAAKLATLQAVGLGYVRLGQPGNTLSGGEAQRLKLALELSKRQTGRTLYLLDEPTTGLHWADVQQLLDLLFRLRDQGNTIIIIEHNVDVMRCADWVVELGPGGGDEGGQLVFAGTVEDLEGFPGSPTGQALTRHKRL